MRTAAILPVKRFSMAKQRLGESVADGLRGQLARAMVADVLAALGETEGIELTIVVTREAEARELAREHEARILPDTAESGQSAAVALGVGLAIELGMERVLCIPGDCPSLDPRDLDGLLLRSEPEVVILPDRHGTGTNGLLLYPPRAIEPSFGPGSCERHRELSARAGRRCELVRLGGLLLDIDTGEDLAALRERLGQERNGAPRTRAVLVAAAGRAGGALPAASG